MLAYLKTISAIALIALPSLSLLGTGWERAIGGATMPHFAAPLHATAPWIGGSSQAGVIGGAVDVAKVADALFDFPFELRPSRLSSEKFFISRLDGPDWTEPRHAFGSRMNEIQYAWEKEGSSPDGIVHMYRPSKVAETEWSGWSIDRRIQYAMQLPPSVRWNSWVRLSDAPDFLRERLLQEAVPGAWEITTDTFNRDVASQLDQMTLARQLAGSPGGGHYHISFLPDPRWAKELTTYLAHLDEILSWSLFESTYANVAHRELGPHGRLSLAKIEQALREGRRLPSRTGRSVEFRSRRYTPRERVGYELRALGDDFAEDRALLERTTEFLEDPQGAILTLREGVPSYTIANLFDVDRLDVSTISRLNDDQALQPLSRIATFADGTLAQSERVNRWAYPLVRWEERPHFAHLAAGIDSTRAVYRDNVLQVVSDWRAAPSSKQASPDWAKRLDLEVYNFAIESKVAQSH